MKWTLTFWCLLLISAEGVLAQRGVGAITGGSLANPTETISTALRDEWPGIPTATNEWAVAIRSLGEWSAALKASIPETRSQAEKGSAVAQLKLGYSYFAGEDGLERDYVEAAKWLEKAAGSGLAPAQFLLGVIQLNGLGVERDFGTGVDWLEKAAKQDFADAQLQLGLCYLGGGPGVPKAPVRGFKWILKAAEQGKPGAQQWAGWCYTTGYGTKEDAEEAVKWYRRSAEQGFATAQDILGLCYYTGNGVSKDAVEATKWYRKAAEQGLPIAQMHLAKCYALGDGVARDLKEAADWYEKAADQGLSGASFHYGLSFFEGQGRSKDAEEAVNWFLRAAEKGHVGAQLYLGLCYYTGQGVTRDEESAAKWWREAAVQGIVRKPRDVGDDETDIEQWWRAVAERGDAKLQCCLAEFYHHGHGVPQNYSEALRWYRRAAEAEELVALKNAAWILATSEDSQLRDGRQAVQYAEKAAVTTKRKDPVILDVLAAAYAETSQFKKAVKTQKEAISLSGSNKERKEYESRLKLYEENTSYRAKQNGFNPNIFR
ncbi:MAG TPA: SEL1-like repeat protein [Clostridia bacterium]|nr:SEL1-like repeat protein [Clostridia bacterium]